MRTVTTKNINEVRAGDVVWKDGREHTISAKDIRRCSFMGVTVLGDSYSLGTRAVEVVTHERALP